MSKKRLFTRRRVLTASGAILATGGVAAGGFLVWDHQKRFGREALRTIADHRVALTGTHPKMVIARGKDPALNVRGAVERIGGMKQFINNDDIVVVKPNIGWQRTPEQGANTHPEIVAEVVRLCLENKPKRLIVSDCPVSKARSAFVRSGIMKAAKKAGAEVILPEESRYHTVKISPRLGTWDVLEPFIIATKIINVPVAKHHTLTGVTAGLKNWIGITGKLRMMFHNSIDQSIAELAALMRPTLTVMDASRVLMEHGPQGGSLADVKAVNTVAVGLDPVALDAWACGLFGKDDLPGSLAIAQKMGLGRIDYGALHPVEITTG